jgi:hypothetical protein
MHPSAVWRGDPHLGRDGVYVALEQFGRNIAARHQTTGRSIAILVPHSVCDEDNQDLEVPFVGFRIRMARCRILRNGAQMSVYV